MQLSKLFEEKYFWKDSDVSWHRKLTLQVRNLSIFKNIILFFGVCWFWSKNITFFPAISETPNSKRTLIPLPIKEVCNGGVAYSLLKLGNLEKTVIASLFHSSLHSGTNFCWKKDVICLLQNKRICPFFDKKKVQKILWCQNWFFDHL